MSDSTHLLAWAEAQDAAGLRDAMGQPFTSWLIARYGADGRALRDRNGAQIFETHAEAKARIAPAITLVPVGKTLDLFV